MAFVTNIRYVIAIIIIIVIIINIIITVLITFYPSEVAEGQVNIVNIIFILTWIIIPMIA